MSRIFLLVFISAVLFESGVSADSVRNRVLQFEGYVRSQVRGYTPTPLSLRYPIHPGVRVLTGDSSSVSVQFADNRSQSWNKGGSIFTFGSNVRATYVGSSISRRKRVMQWGLKKGSILVQMPSIVRRHYKKAASYIEIMTPETRIKSTAANFIVAVTNKGTTVKSIDGEVIVLVRGTEPPTAYSLSAGRTYFSKNTRKKRH